MLAQLHQRPPDLALLLGRHEPDDVVVAEMPVGVLGGDLRLVWVTTTLKTTGGSTISSMGRADGRAWEVNYIGLGSGVSLALMRRILGVGFGPDVRVRVPKVFGDPAQLLRLEQVTQIAHAVLSRLTVFPTNTTIGLSLADGLGRR